MIDGFTLLIFVLLGGVLYHIIRLAVEDGMLRALKKYDELKKDNNSGSQF